MYPKCILSIILIGLLITSMFTGLNFSDDFFASGDDINVTLTGRNFTTNTYYNSSSSQYHQTAYLDYINYQNETSVFHPINTTFEILDNEHFAYQYGYRAYNDKGVFDVYLKPNANTNFPIAYAYNKGGDLNNTHVLRSGIVGVGYYDPSTNHEYSILQNTLSSVGSIDGQTSSYSNIFSGTDLELSYYNSMFKEELVLSNTTKTLLQNNPPSDFGYSNVNSYLVVVTELDYKNIYSYNGTTNISSNFTFNKDIIFKDRYGDVLFSFINAFAYEQNNISNIENMIMRIVHKNNHIYLLTGLKASVLNQMEFPVVFDPSSTKSPGTCVDASGVGTDVWFNPYKASSSNNDDTTIMLPSTGTKYSHYLKCTNFGFSLSGATVNGVMVYIERATNCDAWDTHVYLVKAGSIQTGGNNKAKTTTAWPGSDAYTNYGTSTNKWGLSISGADATNSGFGCALAVKVTGSQFNSVQVDHIYMIVYYTAVVPTVTTRTADTHATGGFRSGGTSLGDGGASITAKGVRYGTSTPPGTNSASSGTGTASYYTTLSGLNENDEYWYRAYATNSIGTGYGSILSTSTLIGTPTTSELDVSAIATNSITLTIDPDPPRENEGDTGVLYDSVSGVGGTDSGWDDFDSGYQDTGLSENSPYVYRAKFQNRVGTDSAYCANDATIYTYAVAPTSGQLDVANFGETWILWRVVDVDNNPDAGVTDGYFNIITNPGGGSSGLSTSDDATYYYFNDTGLTAGQEYGMKVRYDNYNGVDTTYIPTEVKQTTSSANTAPTVDYKTPVNGTTDVAISGGVKCKAYTNDTDADSLTVTWASNYSDGVNWVNYHTNTSVVADTQPAYTYTGFSSYSTKYWWRVYVNDGTENISEIYHFTTESGISIDVDVAPSTWLTGNVDVGMNIQENFTFWQNGSATIDITIGVNDTNFTFVNYTSWMSLGHDRYCANFTTDNWVSEDMIEPGYLPDSVLKSSFAPGNFNFGIRIWMPRTLTYFDKQEDFEIVLVVSESS